MKYLLILTYFLFDCHFSFSQKVFKGTVCTADKTQFIPKATVQVVGTPRKVKASKKGEFKIRIKNKKDSLLVSCIGFNDLKIPANYLKNSDSVFLKRSGMISGDSTVGYKVLDTFGIVTKEVTGSRLGGNPNARSELTTLIPIPEKITSYRINKIFIRGRKFDNKNPVQLHIYTVNQQGLPGADLLKQKVILSKNQFGKDRIITIDVKDRNIVLKNASFFVGVQWISQRKVSRNSGPEFYQTYAAPQVMSYYRDLNFEDHFWFIVYENTIRVFMDGKRPAIGIFGNGNPLNLCASAEIEKIVN